MPTASECVCCHETPEVKAFHLKGKARNTAALEFTEVVVRRCFSKYAFLKISLCLLENTCVGVAFSNTFFLESLFFNFTKKRRCFPANIAKFLRTAFFRTPLMAASKFLTELTESNCEENYVQSSLQVSY